MWKQSQKKNSTQRVLEVSSTIYISEFISDLSSQEIARLSMIRQCKDITFCYKVQKSYNKNVNISESHQNNLIHILPSVEKLLSLSRKKKNTVIYFLILNE